MCLATGLPGSSASHASRICRAWSNSPNVQCASASGRRASCSVGRGVIALLEARRFFGTVQAVEQDPEVRYAST